MPMRSVLLGKVKLIACGATIAIDAITKLAKRKIKSVVGYCPVLGQLTFSSLSYRLEILKDGVYLQIFLVEIHQTHFEMILVYEQGVSKSRDHFRNELTLVLDAIERARGYVTLVASPGINDIDLLSNAGSSTNLRSIRTAMTKDRGKLAVLPGLESTIDIVIPRVPRFLPEGTLMQISAIIQDLSKEKAILRNIRVVDLNGNESIDSSLLCPITMTRSIDGPKTRYRAQIMEAWEQSLRLKMDVVALKKWADGNIGEFVLVKVLPLRKRRPKIKLRVQNTQ